MKKLQRISSLLIILGLIIGFLSVSTTRMGYTVPPQNTEVNQDHQHDHADAEPTLKALEAVPSSPQVILVHQFFLMHVLPEIEEDDSPTVSVENTPSAGSSILKVLFRRIISPNAP